MDDKKTRLWTEHGKVTYLLGYYAGKAAAEEDEVFANLFQTVADDLEWALGVEENEK